MDAGPSPEAEAHALSRHYDELDRQLPVGFDGAYGPLVVPNGNGELPFHRWFHFKEAFSHHLLERVLRDSAIQTRRSITVLDPFLGVGTSLVSADNLGNAQGGVVARGYGIERNPFLASVARCKVESHRSHTPDLRQVKRRALDAVNRGRVDPAPTPGLSTFSNTSYFPRRNLVELLQLRSAIERYSDPGVPRELALLCLAASIEPSSRLRRDGRALRYEAGKEPVPALQEFARRVDVVLADLEGRPTPSRCRVLEGDGRDPQSAGLPNLRADLILFSPPYLNNIDYTEIYKLEAWFVGHLESQAEFREQRRVTLRSHPSVRFPDVYEGRQGVEREVAQVLAPLLDAVPNTKERNWRRRLITGYFDDLLLTLRRYRPLIKPSGRVVYVVGNPVHGTGAHRFVIAADILIGSLAELVGYEVEAVRVARVPARTGATLPFVRESVVFLRPTG
jgi:hypothetical protein